MLELEDLSEAVQAPLQKMEHTLDGWVAFVIIPVFALANAGVTLNLDALRGETLPVLPVATGILAGLLIGKPVGLFGASWLAVRIGFASLPNGITWRHVAGLACLGGMPGWYGIHHVSFRRNARLWQPLARKGETGNTCGLVDCGKRRVRIAEDRTRQDGLRQIG